MSTKKNGPFPFSYQSEKFSAARSALMAPHPKGEAESFMHAFNECTHALNDFDVSHDLINDDVRDWVRIVRETMDTSGIVPDPIKGTHLQKAERLTADQKFEFSR